MAESKKTVVFGNTKGNLKEITKATRDYWKDSPETNVGENIGPNYRNKETEADTVDRLSFPTQDNKEASAIKIKNTERQIKSVEEATKNSIT